MNVLLIWELIPEETSFYFLKDIPEDEYKQILSVNGLYLNSTNKTEEDTEVLINISDALCDKKENCDNPEGPWACKWKDFAVKAPVLANEVGTIDVVIHAGMLL